MEEYGVHIVKTAGRYVRQSPLQCIKYRIIVYNGQYTVSKRVKKRVKLLRRIKYNLLFIRLKSTYANNIKNRIGAIRIEQKRAPRRGAAGISFQKSVRERCLHMKRVGVFSVIGYTQSERAGKEGRLFSLSAFDTGCVINTVKVLLLMPGWQL